MRAILVACALVSLCAAAPAAAVDRLVDDNLVPCLSGNRPLHATISAAVAAAVPGDIILVCAGTYTDNVVVATSDLTVRGQGIVRVIAANVSQDAITITAPRVTVQNLDISGATGTDACGVRAAGTDDDLRDLHVHGNLAGICVFAGTGHRVRTSLIENNGGGIVLRDVGVEILNNTIKNSAVSGLSLGPCPSGAPVTIDHNLFVEPRDAIVLSRCAPVITNNTIRGSGPGSTGIRLALGFAAVITRNLIQNAGGGRGLVFERTIGATASFNTIAFTAIGVSVIQSDGVTVTRNNASRSLVDCFWDGTGANVLTDNNCGTQNPPGAFD